MGSSAWRISYETYTQLSLSLQLSDISLKEKVKLKEIRIKAAPFLEEIDERFKEDFYRFCAETELGTFLVDADLFAESIMFWFGIFAIPFKNQLHGNHFDHLLKDTIFSLDFSKTPEEILETTYPYNKLLSAVFASFYRTEIDDKERYSDNKMLTLYTDAEYACRKSIFNLEDTSFIPLAACRYLQGTLYAGYGMEEELSMSKRECQGTYIYLSQREDLFDNKQRAVLNMLQKLIEQLL